jgi:hypothetical protein
MQIANGPRNLKEHYVFFFDRFGGVSFPRNSRPDKPVVLLLLANRTAIKTRFLFMIKSL